MNGGNAYEKTAERQRKGHYRGGCDNCIRAWDTLIVFPLAARARIHRVAAHHCARHNVSEQAISKGVFYEDHCQEKKKARTTLSGSRSLFKKLTKSAK